MDFHPFADVWPLMTGQPFDELGADIKANGLRQAILVYQQKILDGRNRFRACLKAGVAPRYEAAPVKNDHEALMLSVSLNKHRRHMSEDQLAFVAEQMANLGRGQPSKSKVSNATLLVGEPLITLKEAADAVGISEAKVDRARAVQKYAPDLKQKVLQGKRQGGMSLDAAAKQAADRARAQKGPPRKTAAEVQAINAAKAANHTPRTLLRRDVDPEFVGDDLAFIAEYGHVWMQTSQERSTARLSAWAIAMRHLARKLRDHQLPKITPAVLSWLRKPKQADIETMKAAVTELELALATARDLLERAQSAQIKV